MFYVAIMITFSLFSWLLWKYNLLVVTSYMGSGIDGLNQFDICGLFFGGYDRFIPLDKMVLYG